MTRFTSLAELPALLDPRDFYALTGVRIQTQANWRNQRTNGLPFIRCGHLIRYKREDVLAWLNRNTVGTSTAV